MDSRDYGAKSHNLLSVSWRPRKACDVILSEAEGWRTKGAQDGVNASLGAGEDERRCPCSTVGQRNKGGKFLLPLPFVLFRHSGDWMVPTLLRRPIY